jgi:hypothetical protein
LAELAMPVVLRYKAYVFFFYSNEGEPREAPHIHVRRGADIAKLWLDPNVTVANAQGLSAVELREVVRVARENRAIMLTAWKEFFHE